MQEEYLGLAMSVLAVTLYHVCVCVCVCVFVCVCVCVCVCVTVRLSVCKHTHMRVTYPHFHDHLVLSDLHDGGWLQQVRRETRPMTRRSRDKRRRRHGRHQVLTRLTPSRSQPEANPGQQGGL